MKSIFFSIDALISLVLLLLGLLDTYRKATGALVRRFTGPMRMATDAWNVEGAVNVRFKTRVATRPYTIQEQVFEIDEARYETAESAVAAFVAACEKLAELSLSRDPTVAAWKPEIPDEVGGPPPMY